MSLKNRLKSYLSNYEKGFFNHSAIRYLNQRDPDLWREIEETTNYLKEPLAKQRCWHILNETKDIPTCPYSGDPVDWQGCRYRAFNGRGSNNKDLEHQKKKSEKFFDLHGVTNPAQLESVKAKMTTTNLERYGSANYFSSELGIKKIKDEWADPEKKAKRLESIHKAFMDKFGGYPYQNPEILKKAMNNGFKYRPYTFPSGKTVQIQGYEDMALDELLREGIREDDIITDKGDVPAIWYDFEGRKRRYYPDVYIPSQNRIVEIKSTFSYKYEEAKNETKKKACEDAGFLFEFKIYKSRPKSLT